MTTINDIGDLVRILQERPEWLQAVRGLVIGEELSQVPQRLDTLDQRLAEYAEFTKQNFETASHRMDALDQRLAEFIEFTKQNSETANHRMDALDQRLAEFMEFTKQGFESVNRRLAEYAEFTRQNFETVNRRLDVLEQGQSDLVARQARTEAAITAILRDLATLKGFQTHSAALQDTRRIARTQNCRQVRLLNDDELYDLVENNDTADIVPGEQRSFVAADIVIQAERRDTGSTCYIAVEVSFTAHEDDIRRAARNAGFLTRFTGNSAIPVVASAQVDPKIQPDFDQGPVQWYPMTQGDIEPE